MEFFFEFTERNWVGEFHKQISQFSDDPLQYKTQSVIVAVWLTVSQCSDCSLSRQHVICHVTIFYMRNTDVDFSLQHAAN